MGWCAQALKAAKMAGIFSNDDEWKNKLEEACKKSNNGFIKNAGSSGGFGYTDPGNSGLNGIGVLCMQFHGMGNDPRARNTLTLMDPWKVGWFPTRPAWENSETYKLLQGHKLSPQYYFYYATQAKFMDDGESKRFKDWYKTLHTEYSAAQKIVSGQYEYNGKMYDIGWWENSDEHTDDHRRTLPVMDSCLAALQLMSIYRYLPTTTEAATKVNVEIINAVASEGKDLPVDTNGL
jgi:hypothetical protein